MHFAYLTFIVLQVAIIVLLVLLIRDQRKYLEAFKELGTIMLDQSRRYKEILNTMRVIIKGESNE